MTTNSYLKNQNTTSTPASIACIGLEDMRAQYRFQLLLFQNQWNVTFWILIFLNDCLSEIKIYVKCCILRDCTTGHLERSAWFLKHSKLSLLPLHLQKKKSFLKRILFVNTYVYVCCSKIIIFKVKNGQTYLISC